mgnify:CR=1 FL=1
MELILTLSQDDLDKTPPPVTPDQRECHIRVCQRVLFPCLAVHEKASLHGLLYNCAEPGMTGLTPTTTYVTQFPEVPHDCWPLHFLLCHRLLATKPAPVLLLQTIKSLLVSYGCVLFTLPIQEKEPTDRETQCWLTPRQWIWLVKRHGFTILDWEMNPRLDMCWIAAQVAL